MAIAFRIKERDFLAPLSQQHFDKNDVIVRMHLSQFQWNIYIYLIDFMYKGEQQMIKFM